MAYLAYVSGDLARARELFERLLADDADDPWAAVGLRQLDEARARRVWADAFDRDGPEVLGGWAVEAPYGVTVALRDGAVRFDGSQANEAVGKTRVFRKLEDEQLARFEATVSASPVNRVRFGLRVEGTKRRVVLFFDPAGEVLRASIGKGKGPWSDPIDLGPWPPGRHTLAIDVQDRKADRVVFWIDGQQRGELKLPGIGRARDAVELTLYVQGSALGERADVAFEQARVFVERPEATRRGGGF